MNTGMARINIISESSYSVDKKKLNREWKSLAALLLYDYGRIIYND